MRVEGLKEWVRLRLARNGFVVHRWPTTRFDGMADALLLLARRGYTPRVVIDCGANVGQWTRLAQRVFADAEWHLVEAQPSCTAALDRLRHDRPRMTIHATALTSPGVASVRMLGGNAGTGTFVALPGEAGAGELVVAATTLDALFADGVRASDRALLKLDLEQHELAALEGATRLLKAVEVVLTETSIFDPSTRRPVFGDLFDYLRSQGFEFYDVACLSGRPRDQRLHQADLVFVRRGSHLLADRASA